MSGKRVNCRQRKNVQFCEFYFCDLSWKKLSRSGHQSLSVGDPAENEHSNTLQTPRKLQKEETAVLVVFMFAGISKTFSAFF